MPKPLTEALIVIGGCTAGGVAAGGFAAALSGGGDLPGGGFVVALIVGFGAIAGATVGAFWRHRPN